MKKIKNPYSNNGADFGLANVQTGGVKPHKKLPKFTILICLGALIVAITAVLLLALWPTSTKNSQTKEAAARLAGNDFTVKNQKHVVQDFSADFDANYEQLASSNPGKWQKAELDKAYLCLLYADKINAFSQVDTMLGLIDQAQKGGLNIDNNSYRVDKAQRKLIKQRSDVLKQDTLKSSTRK